MAFVWSKDLETGIPAIDAQHQSLVEAINRLLEACATGDMQTEINKTMKFLLDYTVKHFRDEERLQQQHKYPEYPTHKAMHDQFKKRALELSAQLIKTGPTQAMVDKINVQIGNWLINHIKKEDRKIGAFIKSGSNQL